jgi:hypothetical protein
MRGNPRRPIQRQSPKAVFRKTLRRVCQQPSPELPRRIRDFNYFRGRRKGREKKRSGEEKVGRRKGREKKRSQETIYHGLTLDGDVRVVVLRERDLHRSASLMRTAEAPPR